MSVAGPNPNITRRAVVQSFSYQMSRGHCRVPSGHTLETCVKQHKWFIAVSLHFNAELSAGFLEELSVYPLRHDNVTDLSHL